MEQADRGVTAHRPAEHQRADRQHTGLGAPRRRRSGAANRALAEGHRAGGLRSWVAHAAQCTWRGWTPRGAAPSGRNALDDRVGTRRPDHEHPGHEHHAARPVAEDEMTTPSAPDSSEQRDDRSAPHVDLGKRATATSRAIRPPTRRSTRTASASPTTLFRRSSRRRATSRTARLAVPGGHHAPVRPGPYGPPPYGAAAVRRAPRSRRTARPYPGGPYPGGGPAATGRRRPRRTTLRAAAGRQRQGRRRARARHRLARHVLADHSSTRSSSSWPSSSGSSG